MLPWPLFVIKTLNKSMVGEQWWRRQSLVEKYTMTMTMWSWKRFKVSWMGHGPARMGITWGNMKYGWMGPNRALKTLHVSGAWVARASKCMLGHPSKLDMFQWVVSRFKFWGSCFEVCDFWLAETDVRPPPKYDTFPYQFVPGPTLPVHGNPRQVASKWMTHLQLLVEILLGVFTL
jgi:hypothetical protein